MDEISLLARGKRAGDRLGTEAEFVKQFNVSLVTVRQALQRLEVEGIVERRQGSGTFVPEVGAQKKHVGILFEADPNHPRASPFFLSIARQLRSQLRSIGIANRTYYGTAPLGNLNDGRLTNEDILDDARLGRLNGVVTFYAQRHSSWMDVFTAHGVPVLDSQLRWEKGGFSKRQFFAEAMKHFKNQGRQRIAVLGLEVEMSGKKPVLEEIAAAAAHYGLELDRRLLDLSANGGTTGIGWERFRDIWRGGGDKPDALILIDDMMFDDCQKAILELQITIPRDLELVIYTSDAVELRPQFPLLAYQISTADTVDAFSRSISAMLAGEPLPDWWSGEIKRKPALMLLQPDDDDLPALNPSHLSPAYEIHT